MKSLLSKDEKTKLLETLRRQGIIICKAGIEIEMPSFDGYDSPAGFGRTPANTPELIKEKEILCKLLSFNRIREL